MKKKIDLRGNALYPSIECHWDSDIWLERRVAVDVWVKLYKVEETARTECPKSTQHVPQWIDFKHSSRTSVTQWHIVGKE